MLIRRRGVFRGQGLAELEFFCFQAEDGIRELLRSRGLGDVYKRQQEGQQGTPANDPDAGADQRDRRRAPRNRGAHPQQLSLIHI